MNFAPGDEVMVKGGKQRMVIQAINAQTGMLQCFWENSKTGKHETAFFEPVTMVRAPQPEGPTVIKPQIMWLGKRR